jgi:hypothetical protein
MHAFRLETLNEDAWEKWIGNGSGGSERTIGLLHRAAAGRGGGGGGGTQGGSTWSAAGSRGVCCRSNCALA